MRTNDFSAAPSVARGGAEFVGETEYRSLRVMWQFFRLWLPMYRRLKRLPGYRGLHWWYRFPRTLGMVVFFDDQRSLYQFARGKDHAQGMLWLTTNGRARAGFIRIYDAQPAGYTNGLWRAETAHTSRAMSVDAIRRFTPLAGEDQGPLVTEVHR